MKIAFCSSEVFPFAKTGGLGDVCGALPIALDSLECETAVFMPGYRCTREAGQKLEQLSDCVSRSKIGKHTFVYFINHPTFFDRQGLYGDGTTDFPDNLDRFHYFCEQTLECLKSIDYQPDIIHCHDWQTALIPVLLKEKYKNEPAFKKIKSVLTIHNLAFQGIFPESQFAKLGLDKRLYSEQGFKFYDQVCLLKAGIIYSDMVTTVSHQYAREIQTKEFGCGLESVIKTRRRAVTGILNGLDVNIWNPQTDSHLARRYSKDDYPQAKAENKAQVQKVLGLNAQEVKPLFGFVGRLSHQKGIDVIIDSLEAILNMGAQVVILGLGEKKYEETLKSFASENSENCAVCTDFNEPLGHHIYAASDYFLMPSRFEPCGLSQLISLAYGTIPIVFKTGGLADTITPFGFFSQDGNGLMFDKYSQDDFLNTIQRAVKIFRNDKQFNRLRNNTFRDRFTWTQSAKRYKEVYQCA